MRDALGSVDTVALAPVDARVGAVLCGSYEIIELLGAGGMGVVYRARQLVADREVALKLLRRELAEDADAVRRFETELVAMKRLRHPANVQLIDCGRTDGGELFIVTELLRGTPLSKLRAAESRLPAARALAIVRQACGALQEAHEAGIVHRDIKPDNIFVDHAGGDELVKVLDYGIAKLADGGAPLTAAGQVMGTPAYMAPEQASGGAVDARADVYSLGIVLYELLCGAVPFEGGRMQVMYRHVHEPPRPIAVDGVSKELARLVMEMLAKQPRDRPASMAAVRDRVVWIQAAALMAAQPSATMETGTTLANDARLSPARGAVPPVWAAIAGGTLVAGVAWVVPQLRETETLPRAAPVGIAAGDAINAGTDVRALLPPARDAGVAADARAALDATSAIDARSTRDATPATDASEAGRDATPAIDASAADPDAEFADARPPSPPRYAELVITVEGACRRCVLLLDGEVLAGTSTVARVAGGIGHRIQLRRPGLPELRRDVMVAPGATERAVFDVRGGGP